MSTDPKPLTRDGLLKYSRSVAGNGHVGTALSDLFRHCAALLPAEGLPPIDKDDERTVDALVAARTGQARRMVTHHCPDCAHRVQERDAAIARAEAAEKRVAELRDCFDRAQILLGALREWTRQYGSALVPKGADTYGEGMRDAKQQVWRIVDGAGPLEAVDGVYAAGIREGLERAAVLCEREAEACRGHQRATADMNKRVPLSTMHECAAKQNDACAHYIRAMKDSV